MIKYPAMSGWRIAFGVLAWVLSVAGCTSRNPIYCGDGVCVDPAFPFCDIDGEIAGQPRTCVAVTCTPATFVACRGDQAITCDSTGGNYQVVQCEQGCSEANGGCSSSCASDGACVTVQVATTGDDANDGLTAPVRTLKRAIGIASNDRQVMRIQLASGRYGIANGETYPYIVPPNVAVVGPAGGSVILAGTGIEGGLTIQNGRLADIEFEDFAVAMTSTGVSELSHVRVRTSTVAVRGETTARLTVNDLDITGSRGACARGIELFGNAVLEVNGLATRALGTTLSMNGESSATVTSAVVMGDNTCEQVVFGVETSSTFAMTDAVVDGGRHGLGIEGTPTPAQVTLTNTTMRNFTNGAISGRNLMFTMVGGELSNNDGAGVTALSGTWSFTNVTIKNHFGTALYAQGDNRPTPPIRTKLTMRGCTVVANGIGVDLLSFVIGDFGTPESPGNNIFKDSGFVSLHMGGFGVEQRIDAVGNTWKSNIQGSDSVGRYPVTMTVTGPITAIPGNNYAIQGDWPLLR